MENNSKQIQKSRWDKIHSNYQRDKITYDDWLDRFAEKIKQCQTPILDLGCGSGNDTLYLVEMGKEVIPCDYSSSAVQNIKKNFPEVKKVECFDMTGNFPFPDNFTYMIIADLSLHYFTQQVTTKVLTEIKRVLKPNGLLAFRVNSTKDIYHDAGRGEKIEEHLYFTEEKGTKRFFDRADIDYFFGEWSILFLKEENMERYDSPKTLWCCLAEVNKPN